MFDDLPALAAPKPLDLQGELYHYLSTDPEYDPDVLAWWYRQQKVYPHLSRMVMDYLSISGDCFFPSLSKVQTSTQCLHRNVHRCWTCLQQRSDPSISHLLSPACPVNSCFDVCWGLESVGLCEGYDVVMDSRVWFQSWLMKVSEFTWAMVLRTSGERMWSLLHSHGLTIEPYNYFTSILCI